MLQVPWNSLPVPLPRFLTAAWCGPLVPASTRTESRMLLFTDRLYGHVVKRKGRTKFLAFARYLGSVHPPEVRIAIVLDNFSPHLSTKTDSRVGNWAKENNVELAYVPFYGSWLNRVEAQFTALRYFALDGTDYPSHREQASMIRRYIAWRNGTSPTPVYARSSNEPRASSGRRLPDAALARSDRPWRDKLKRAHLKTRSADNRPSGGVRPGARFGRHTAPRWSLPDGHRA